MKKIMPVCLLMATLYSGIALGGKITIDGMLNEPEYARVTPLKGEISSLYLIPTVDALYISAEVEDNNINVANPMEFWNISCVEVWFDWGNNDSAQFDKDDQQFWFCPVKGNGNKGYTGQWHRASDNIKDTIYDYANNSELMDMAFTVQSGKGYTIEAMIEKQAMGGYKTNGMIGFNYSADKGGTKFEWEKAGIGGNFYEKPDTWPDLEIVEIQLAVRAESKLPVMWGVLRSISK